jgi:hypothetical protein
MTASPRWRVALASAASAAALVAGPLVGAQTAHAQDQASLQVSQLTTPRQAPYPPRPGTLTLSATTVRAGGSVSFTATGFRPSQQVAVVLQSFPVVLGHFRADGTGTVTGTVTIPRHTRPGGHLFRVVGIPGRSLAARIWVLPSRTAPGGHANDDKPGGTASRAGLAEPDGTKNLALGGTAAGLVTVGGGALLAVRRRRS